MGELQQKLPILLDLGARYRGPPEAPWVVRRIGELHCSPQDAGEPASAPSRRELAGAQAQLVAGDRICAARELLVELARPTPGHVSQPDAAEQQPPCPPRQAAARKPVTAERIDHIHGRVPT